MQSRAAGPLRQLVSLVLDYWQLVDVFLLFTHTNGQNMTALELLSYMVDWYVIQNA